MISDQTRLERYHSFHNLSNFNFQLQHVWSFLHLNSIQIIAWPKKQTKIAILLGKIAETTPLPPFFANITSPRPVTKILKFWDFCSWNEFFIDKILYISNNIFAGMKLILYETSPPPFFWIFLLVILNLEYYLCRCNFISFLQQ